MEVMLPIVARTHSRVLVDESGVKDSTMVWLVTATENAINIIPIR